MKQWHSLLLSDKGELLRDESAIFELPIIQINILLIINATRHLLIKVLNYEKLTFRALDFRWSKGRPSQLLVDD